MSKKQKIWLAVFLAMFVILEIIWPQITITLYFWIREIFFGISVKAGELSKFSLFDFNLAPKFSGLIFATKSISLLLGFIYSVFSYRQNHKLSIMVLMIILGLLLFVTGYYILFIINFAPQIG